MKKTAIYYFSLAALAAGSFASCQDYQPFDEEVVREAAIKKKYAEEFVKTFGEISPDHNWGFDDISASKRPAQTRGTVDNRNEWVSYYHLVVPGDLESDDSAPWGWTTGDISQYERAYVYWWLSTHKNPTSLNINWSDYFIQNLWGQPEHQGLYADGSGYSTSMTMDKLCAYEPNNTTASEGNFWEHIKDLNEGGGAKEQICYVTNSSTLNFSYHCSEANAVNGKGAEHVLVCINGNYYLAFDYKSQTTNTHNSGGESMSGVEIECDGYFNDWILKLTPGKRKEDDGYTRRIMCEDLTLFDNDFNDVVFDVTFLLKDEQTGKGQAVITLQAAGGTLPVYVGKFEPQYEVHKLFGLNDSKTPINVINDGKKRPAVIYYYPDELQGTQINGAWTFNPEQIPIYVEDSNHAVTLLSSPVGSAPQKFSCPNHVNWSLELTPIYDPEKQRGGYVHFMDWVGANNTWKDTWYNDRDYTYLYGDNGASYTFQTGYMPNDEWGFSDIKDWQWLFDNRANAVTWNNNQSAADAASQVFTTVQPGNLKSFDSQKPYIYYTNHTAGGTDENLKVLSPGVMSAVLNSTDVYAGKYVTKDWSFNDAELVSRRYAVNAGVNNFQFGSVQTSDGKSNYTEGSDVTLVATPLKEYFEFVNWNDGVTENPRIFNNISQNINVTANFRIKDSYFETDPLSEGVSLPEGGTTCLVHLVGNSSNYSVVTNTGNISNWLQEDWTTDIVIENATSINVSGVKSYTIRVKKETSN